MRDNISILVKRAKNYIDDNGDLIKGIGDLILEYGEMLYLEDLACLIMGEGKFYDSLSEAQRNTTRTYWDSIKQDEKSGKYIGGPVVVELYLDHEYFAKATSPRLYNDASFEKEIPSGTSSTLIANTKFVQDEITTKLNTKISGLVSTVEGTPGTTSTITSLSEKDGKVYAKFEPITLSSSDIPGIPTPGTIIPNPSNPIGSAGFSSNYAREDHIHKMDDGGSENKPVYIKNGNPVEVGNTIDVSVTGNASTTNKMVKSDGSSITTGTVEKPIYFKNGVPAQCNNTLDVNIKGYAPRVGTDTIGTASKPIYLKQGYPYQCNETLDSNISGNSATSNKLNSNAGTNEKPVYFNDGIPVQCNDTLDVSIKGNAATANKVVNSDGSSITAGTNEKPVYVKNGIPIQCDNTLNINVKGHAAKLGTADIGTTKNPIYLEKGVPKQCDNTLDVNISGNAKYAESAGKLTSDAGSKDKPIYFNNGVPTICEAPLSLSTNGSYSIVEKDSGGNEVGVTKGSETSPIYFFNGVPTECGSSLAVSITGSAAKLGTTDVGSSAEPIYLNKGTATKCSNTLSVSVTGSAGKATKLYYKSGQIDLDVDCGTTHKPVYFNKGVPNVCTAPLSLSTNSSYKLIELVDDEETPISAGSATEPIYFKDGIPTKCNQKLDADISGTADYALKISGDGYGSNKKPIYIGSDGVPKQCDDSLDISITGSASKLGTTTVGSSTEPIYLNSGVATKCGSELDVSITGNAGSADKLNSDAGSSSTPVYFENGVPVSCTGPLDIDINGLSGKSNILWDSTGKKAYSIGSSSEPVYFKDGIPTKCGDSLAVSITGSASKLGSTTVGSSSEPIYLNSGSPYKCTSLSLDTTGSAAKVKSSSSNSFYIGGVKEANGSLYYNTSVSVSSGNVLMGAAWNDIAEFREGECEAGYCVCEDGNGKLVKSSKHLQKCPYVVSDTYGFAIGETEKCKLPIAISGRVLVNSRESLKVGDVVCAGKDGYVEKMNRLEIILFPDRILGIVSEIPSYDRWNDLVDVNNRIWIKVV